MRNEKRSRPVTYSADVIVRARAEIGEGPVVDHRTGRLCWVDIVRGTLFEEDLVTGTRLSTTAGCMLGAAAPRRSAPGFAVAVAEGLGYLVDGTLTVSEPVLPETARRMNDAKCDSGGRMWAGSTHLDFRSGGGMLHCWDGEGPSQTVVEGLTLPNGMGWSPRDDEMYLVDSMKRVVLSASYTPHNGGVSPFSVLFEIDGGLPDGLAVDVDGCIWLALWDGHEVRRYDKRGRVLGAIPMPVAKPTSCAFGDDGTLYITSATDGLSQAELAQQPLAGSVFAVATGTHGVPVTPFAK